MYQYLYTLAAFQAVATSRRGVEESGIRAGYRGTSGRVIIKRLVASFLLATVSGTATASAQVPVAEPELSEFRLSGVTLRRSSYDGVASLEMRMPSSAYQDPSREKLSDRNFMAWLPLDFQNGTVEVEVASDLAPDAPDYARGFIGLAFRIDRAGRFESIYLRPTNSMSLDQVRRNHSVQYAAYPDYRFDRLRREAPEKYETYAEISTGRWITMRIVIQGMTATLYLDGSPRPAFVV
ncbi:hypothetical protein SAMN05428974_3241 [Sphingopyxis sp. YR583]|uniref:hypothetical protein n=1 Tax=Sphingopyxis sp. YR583 TaxID=1881047 RepID=UPI0008A7AECA|nr:hypothetical protein [Sphingopyxis sp. YR583]SEH19148.1 hypothetical protein SAMN05428974_3241 [Sphingopyxis sp. YR583]